VSQPLVGAPAPWFEAPSHTHPRFAFSSLGGRFVLLGFLPQEEPARAVMLEGIGRKRHHFDAVRLAGFLITREEAAFGAAKDARGLHWFLDKDGKIGGLYGAHDDSGAVRPTWVLIDPSLRVIGCYGAADTDGLCAALDRLPAPDSHAGVPLWAPVLLVPRILERSLCRELIELYEADGGAPSGVMRQEGGKTIAVLDSFKRRRDAQIENPDLQAALRNRLRLRLLPEIRKAFQFEATRIERYIVACYDAGDGGYFRAHRDNTTLGTAHRKFAVSINLNAEEHEGGDLRFPEFGSRTYRPPTGGAVVFSCSLLHEATPVTRGRRYATLPFLYDDAGATIREQNRHALVSEVEVSQA
jgi:predicted 2-oxoglutarate/Fe(II)-dependent dioxygenase YbiX